MIEPALKENLVRQLKGVNTLCNAALELSCGEVLLSLLRDLAVKSQSALIELKKEPVKA